MYQDETAVLSVGDRCAAVAMLCCNSRRIQPAYGAAEGRRNQGAALILKQI